MKCLECGDKHVTFVFQSERVIVSTGEQVDVYTNGLCTPCLELIEELMEEC